MKRLVKSNLAVGEIIILVIAIFALSWMLGQNIEVVSAAEGDPCVASMGCLPEITCGGDIEVTRNFDCQATLGVEDSECVLGKIDTKECSNGCTPVLGCNSADGSDDSNGDGSSDWLGTAGKVTGGLYTADKFTGGHLSEAIQGMFSNPTVEEAAVSAVGEKALFEIGHISAETIAQGGAYEAAGVSLGASILFNAAIAVGLGYLTYNIAKWIGVDEDAALIAGLIVGGAFVVGAIVGGATGWLGATTITLLGATAAIPVLGWVVAAVAAITLLLVGKKQASQIILASCQDWRAVTGGRNCEDCNNQDFPCTEYSCKSLGKACELDKDPESEDYGLCFWKNPNDRSEPIINPWNEAPFFDTERFRYVESSTVSPPDQGVYISYIPMEGERVSRGEENIRCMPPFAYVPFGIESNEIATCKVSSIRPDGDYASMPEVYFSNGHSDYNHSTILYYQSTEIVSYQLQERWKLEILEAEAEGADAEELQIIDDAYAEEFELLNDREYEYYVRCEDNNGNANRNDLVFKFCISDFDGSPPLILYSQPASGNAFGFGQTEMPVSFYVNEPANCKWDRVDRSYEDMMYPMECENRRAIDNGQNTYKCTAIFDGLRDRVPNTFYVRCEDKPIQLSEFKNITDDYRFSNDVSYEFVLQGTEPLVISEITVNGQESGSVLEDSTIPMPVDFYVKTDAGADNGIADCFISESGEVGTFAIFADSDSTEHYQTLWLAEGDYEFHIRCIDIGGNFDEGSISFTNEIDLESSNIIRVYKNGNDLMVITDEESDCYYSTYGCTYSVEDASLMSSGDGKAHAIDWDASNNYYIKCVDMYGNQPLPNECSLEVRPVDVPEVTDIGF